MPGAKKSIRIEGNLVKRGILLGLGILDLTKERAEELLNETAKSHGLSVVQGRKLAESMIKKNKQQGKVIAREIESRLEDIMKRAAEKTVLLSRIEIDMLEKHLKEQVKKQKNKVKKQADYRKTKSHHKTKSKTRTKGKTKRR